MQEIKKIALLARIKGEDVSDIPRILSYVEKLNSVNVSDVEPLFHFPEMRNAVRDDVCHHTPAEVRKAMMSMGKDEKEFLKVESIL